MLLLNACDTLRPLIRLIKFGVIPVIQAAIIVILIVMLVLDLGKAVAAGKEDEIKSAQKLAIKRVVYAVVVFLVPWIVSVAFSMLSYTGTDGTKEADNALGCYGIEKK